MECAGQHRSAITSYTLQQSANNGQSWSTVSGHSGMSHDVSGLTLGTAYLFRVRATNGAGAGAWSDASTAAQPNAVPGKPNPPTVTVLSATSLRVSWDAPVNTGSAITGYTLQQSEDNGQSWSAVSGVSGTSTSKDVTGLTTGDSYVFRVQATNTAGTGTSSEASTAAVPADVAPGKPDAPTVAVLSATSLRVSWNAPTNTGSAITSYTLQQSEDNGTNWSAVTGHSGTSHDVTGLTLGTVYVFRVQATNGAGPGTWSDASTAAQPNAVPDKPNPPTVTVLSATSLRVSWDAPFNTGSAITGYTLQQSEDNGQSWSAVSGVSGTSTSKDVTGLTTGDSYVFRVQATNTAWATGTWSDASTAAVPADVAPGKPDAPTVAVLSATSLRVSWNAPVNTGSAITSYTLEQSEDNGTNWSAVTGVSGTGTSHDVSGLTLGTAYLFRVRATNGAGAGAWSDASTAAQPNAVPGKPNPPTVTVLSATSLRVSWDAPVNTGSAITGYTLQQSEDNGQSWSAVSGVSGTSTSKDVTGLTTGDSYVFRVQATNTAGTGTSSEASTAAVPADVAPGKPDAPTVAVLSATSLRVSWNAPTNTGSAITSYTLQQSEDNGTNWSAVTGHSGTSHDVTGLTLGTVYVFRVQATNGAGPGTWSDASTAAQPNAVPDKPNPPTVTVLSATSLRVSWDAPFNTGSAITGYTLQQSEDNGQSWSAVSGVSGTSTSKDVTGLTTGDSYVFRVQATNTAGTGTSSEASTAAVPADVAPGKPDAPTVTITLDPAAFNAVNDVIEATFRFSEAVTGFDLTDVTVDGGSKPNTALVSSQNGKVYTGTFTATGNSGDLTVKVAADAATDSAGNTGPASEVSETAVRDTTEPTVEITGVPGHVANNDPFTVTFTFDEVVSGFATDDVTVTNGVLSNLTEKAGSNGVIYTAEVTPDGNGDVKVEVAANRVTDVAGNTGPAGAVSETAVYDADAPTLAITLAPAAFNSDGDAIEATFTFSKAVTGFDLTDVTVSGGTKPNTALTSSQNGAVYTGTFTTTGGSGDLVVTVQANQATDAAGNTGPASAVSETAVRDTAAPGVTITGVPGHVANTNPFTVTFTFDEPVSGFVAGDVTVSNGVLGTLTASAVQSEVGKVWSAPVTPNGDGDVDVTVLANAVTDAAGNTGPAADVSETAVYDAAAPTEIVIETETVEETDTDYVVSAGALKVTVKVKRGTPAGIMLTLPEDIVSGIEITLSPSKHDVPLDAAGYGFGANMQDRTVVDVSSTGRLAHLCLPVSQALRTEAGDQDLVLLHHVRGAWKAEDSYTEAGRTRVCADDVTEFSPFAAAYKTNKTNTAPVFEQASHEFKLAENRIGPVELVTLTATDKDAGDTIAYALSAGDTNLFSIDETSGALSYIGPGEDFEIEPNRHDLTVSATDGGRLSATTAVTVTVINVNEAPVFEQASYEFKLAENRIGPVELVTLTATDKDAGDTIAYALSAGDTNLFSIDETSGALSYIGPGEDFESEPNRYDLTVSATDGERLSAEAEVTVTVTDEDEGAIARARLRRVNEAILPELSRAIVSGVVESVADRIEDARMRMAGDARLAIAGHPVGAAAADEEVLERIRLREARDRRHRWQETLDAETMDWKEALRGTSFALPLSGGDSVSPGGPGAVTVWGGGDRRALSGGDRGRPVEWDGDVVGARLGVDARLRDDLLAGLALSWSRGSFDWTDRSDAGDQEMKGTHGSEMTSLHPYVGWWSGEGASLWASLGYGRGDVEIEDDEAGRQTSDAALSTAAAGGRVLLFSGDGALPGGMTSLALRGETWLSRFEVEDNGDRMAGLTANTHRLRVGLEGAYERRLAGGGSLTPSLEVGVRHDGGDGETGLGVDLGGGLAWRDPALGLTVEGRARVLLIHRGDIGEWGASGSVRLDPGAGGLGLSFGLRPSWGAAAEGGVDRLWQDGPDSRLARAAANDNAETPSPAMGLEAELGYGMAAPGGHGVLTPYGGLSLSDGGSRSWRVGGRLAIGPSFTLGLEGERQESGDATPDHGVTLTGTVRW